MTEYIDIPFESDPDALSQEAFDYLTNLIPNWIPSEGNLDVWLIRAIARIAGEVQDIAVTVPTTIFRYAGANLFNIQPLDATSAIGYTTWVMTDTAGYTIPAGTLVGVRTSGSDLIPFQTVNEVTIAPGGATTATGGVQIEAVNPGAAGTGLSGVMELIDAITNVSTITLVGPTTSGVDAESDEQYLNRLAIELQLLTPRPIIPSDFSAMALSIPGVYRALAIDGYNPVDGTFDNERMIAIAALDEAGQGVGSPTRLAVLELLDSSREVNFVVNVITPTYTGIDVSFVVHTNPGYNDVVDVASRVSSAISDFLDPANWGVPSSGDTIEWVNEDTVRYLSLGEAVNAVPGVRYIETLVFGPTGGSLDTIDIILPGVAPLPTAGIITGTAVI